jgi:hypothetical protein
LITNKGKDILAKYLINQAPTYASHIAIGSGAQPLQFADDLDDYSEKKALDFEMFRIPIVSRGYIEEDGVSKIVFVGELPSEERYEITEIGIFSAGSNVNAGSSDSQILFSFSLGENWEFHNTGPGPASAEALELVLTPLNSEDPAFIDSEYDSTAFLANSTNGVFDTDIRLSKQERPRLLDASVFISGNTSQIQELEDGDLEVLDGSLSSHVHYTDVSIEELAQNSSGDIIKTAFSIVEKEASIDSPGPDKIKIIIEFLSSEETGATLARIPIVYDQIEFENNRYIVNSTTLGEMKGKENGFTWQGVNVVRIYASTEKEYDILPGTEYPITAVALTDTSTKLQFTSAGHGLLVGSKVQFSGVSGITTVKEVTDIETDTFKILGTTEPELADDAKVTTVVGVTLTDTNTKLQFTTTSNHGFAVGSKVDLSGVSGITDPRSITDVTEDTFKIAETTLPTLTSATAAAPTSNYLIAMDGIRLDNISTPSSLYGLTAYSPIVNLGRPITKLSNSSNIVEFRFAMSVGGENVGPES